MENVWERFESIATPEEVKEVRLQSEPVDAGDYEAQLEQIEATTSKNGLPMLKVRLKLTESGRTIYFNQMLQNMNDPKITAYNIEEARKFVSKIMNEDLEFTGLTNLANTISEIEVGNVYNINVSYGAKDINRSFMKVRVMGNADALATTLTDDDIPF